MTPSVDDGRYAAKCVVGDRLVIEADLVSDGHDHVMGLVRYRPPAGADAIEVPLVELVNDRFRATFVADTIGRWTFEIIGWVDSFGTWRHGLERKADAGVEVSLELEEGALLIDAAVQRAAKEDAAILKQIAARLRNRELPLEDRVAEALSKPLEQRMHRYPDRSFATHSRTYPVTVDPTYAAFSAWYEMFPRSAGRPGEHGTFRDCEEKLPYVVEMGFDVLYFPPIHPIGTTFRKGPNNTLQAGPNDVGSPWAIGGPEGGHTAIHPQLGTLEDFRRLVEKAAQHKLLIALDIAFQCSPDHPWVKEHPQWFRHRPDGTIQYAENPPKKYQDVYPFDFETDDWKALWTALRDVFMYWAEQGVRVFRVDNPHTKPLPFWEWCITEVKAKYPNAIFLAEAFTRPKLMYQLGKLGFNQSYTYFTWRNNRWELTEYLEELTREPVKHFFRPNFWPNTPDILPEELQWGGRPAFITRLVLAATMSSNYGIYGPAYELMEHVARPGSGEYIDNEKFQLREWDLNRSDSLRPIITRLNRIRREHKAFQRTDNITFQRTDNEQLICFTKRDEDEVILVVANLDHHHKQSGWLELDLPSLNLGDHDTYQVHDLLGGGRYLWTGRRNYVELDPHAIPAHIFRLRKRVRTERDFDYFV